MDRIPVARRPCPPTKDSYLCRRAGTPAPPEIGRIPATPRSRTDRQRRSSGRSDRPERSPRPDRRRSSCPPRSPGRGPRPCAGSRSSRAPIVGTSNRMSCWGLATLTSVQPPARQSGPRARCSGRCPRSPRRRGRPRSLTATLWPTSSRPISLASSQPNSMSFISAADGAAAGQDSVLSRAAPGNSPGPRRTSSRPARTRRSRRAGSSRPACRSMLAIPHRHHPQSGMSWTTRNGRVHHVLRDLARHHDPLGAHAAGTRGSSRRASRRRRPRTSRRATRSSSLAS